jgi:hypothetical protein
MRRQASLPSGWFRRDETQGSGSGLRPHPTGSIPALLTDFTFKRAWSRREELRLAAPAFGLAHMLDSHAVMSLCFSALAPRHSRAVTFGASTDLSGHAASIAKTAQTRSHRRQATDRRALSDGVGRAAVRRVHTSHPQPEETADHIFDR